MTYECFEFSKSGKANNYVSQKLHEWSLNNEVEQNPRFEYNVSGDFIFVKVPKKVNLELNSRPTKTLEIIQSEDQLDKIFGELSFMSDEEIYAKRYLFDEIRAYLTSGYETQRAKKFLTKLFETRFSSSLPNVSNANSGRCY